MKTAFSQADTQMDSRTDKHIAKLIAVYPTTSQGKLTYSQEKMAVLYHCMFNVILSKYQCLSISYKTFLTALKFHHYKAKEKYRGMFEVQKSGDKTSSGEIGLDIRTHASPKVGQDQVSGGVSVLCWHASPVAYVLWQPCTIR